MFGLDPAVSDSSLNALIVNCLIVYYNYTRMCGEFLDSGRWLGVAPLPNPEVQEHAGIASACI